MSIKLLLQLRNLAHCQTKVHCKGTRAQPRQALRQTDLQQEQGNFQQRCNKMKNVPDCYPNHLWGIPPAEEGEHPQLFAAPFMAQRLHERAPAQALVGVGGRELSDHLKNTWCWAAGNHSNHQHCFKLHFWSTHHTAVSSHLCLPCSTTLCPPRWDPASLYPACM